MEYGWCHLGRLRRDQGGGLLFPSMGFVPVVYRFRLFDIGPEWHFFGEASEPRRRFQQYRTPGSGQRTDLRLNVLFREHLDSGGEVEIDTVADGVELASGGRPAPVDLNDAAMRSFVESAAILASVATGQALLNSV